ncbi:alpha/beta fold hydrolase [Streptomyces chromofuscus]|uniref:Alpha/beta fold hydrolase n=1 Tax=Streptomyces chromofuscus TaxID=42881 RepID=A0A7M2TAM6_STRCW|nr:alpha/beta fold hydrolase [Streptomyces chromofuscus]QOV45179.1 alpha/beta fold hydrolase [Streptomyces chromofuscus]GGS99759.1 alpha/beta hydrolase [Streptomyces chromofuscus]
MSERPVLAPLRRVGTDVLEVAYYETGSAQDDTVPLLHGFPYDLHSYVDVAPLLADSGFRVVVPHLRGHGPTTLLSGSAPRSGQQAALGADVVALLDALGVERAHLAGYDWGGRAPNVAAALWPERVLGLVSVNSHLIQDIGAAAKPLAPELDAGFWYFWCFYYLLTERDRAGLAQDPRGIARVIWKRNSPKWPFHEHDPERAARAFANPDCTDVVLHPYRHRLGFAPGAEEYADLEARLTELPPITVPAVTLDGTADGNFPASDGSSTARRFTGPRLHRTVADPGHKFAAAVRDVRALRQENTRRDRLTGRRQDTP